MSDYRNDIEQPEALPLDWEARVQAASELLAAAVNGLVIVPREGDAIGPMYGEGSVLWVADPRLLANSVVVVSHVRQGVGFQELYDSMSHNVFEARFLRPDLDSMLVHRWQRPSAGWPRNRGWLSRREKHFRGLWAEAVREVDAAHGGAATVASVEAMEARLWQLAIWRLQAMAAKLGVRYNADIRGSR